MSGPWWRGAAGALLFAATVILPAAAMGQAGRYTLVPSPDGALRLDTETGAVSHCARKSSDWVCESVADDRQALQREIDRLTRENDNLRGELDMLRAGLVPGPEDVAKPGAGAEQEPDSSRGGDGSQSPNGHAGKAPEIKPEPRADDEGEALRSPNGEDIDKLVTFFERMVRRLHDMMEQLKQQQNEPPQQRL